MPTREEFLELYKTGPWKRRYNAAMRAEIPGGDETLDLLELVSKARHRGRIDNPLKFLETIEDKLQDTRDAMVAALQAKYEITPKEDPE